MIFVGYPILQLTPALLIGTGIRLFFVAKNGDPTLFEMYEKRCRRTQVER